MKSTKWNQVHFKGRLHVALILRGLTQRHLAKKLKVAPATVSRWHNSGANYPGLDHLQAAADYLKVEAGWLAFGTGKPPPGLTQALLNSKPKRGRPKSKPKTPVRGRVADARARIQVRRPTA